MFLHLLRVGYLPVYGGVIIDTMSRHNEGFPYIPGLDEYTLALLAGFSSFFVSIVVLPQKSE